MNMKITIVITAIFVAGFTSAFSQAPAKQWDADFGGSEYEQFAAAQQTIDGGYIIGGYSESDISGDKTQPTRGSSDYWVVKTDANGIKQWDARFGGSSVDQLTCLQQTIDGGYILGGISFSGADGDKSQASQGSSDYWIVKIDANGAKQWDARFGGTLPDELRSLQQTADGGFILGGASLSDISGDKTQKTRGGKDFWIVKTDANGVKQWDARFGGKKFEELFSLQQTKDGGYMLGGYSLSDPSGDKTDPSRGRYDFWIVKTNANGKKQWDASYGGSDDDWLTQLRQTTGGGYILGGWSWSGNSGDKSQPTKGANDYWIIKIDNIGVRQWDASFGGSSNDYLNPIEQTADGGYILGGYSSSPVSGDKTQDTEGGTDYWMVKTNANGVKQWDADFGGSDFEFLSSLQQTKDGGLILGGYSASGISGDKSQDTKGFNDYWIVKTSADGVSCNIPVNLTATDIGTDRATVRWDIVTGALKYNVSYRIAGATQWTIVNAESNRKELRGLFDGTKYEWRVRTVCGGQQVMTSRWSVKKSFTTLPLLGGRKTPFVSSRSLEEVYPNPFSQSATVSFSVSKSSTVKIELIDINGRSLKLIADKNFSGGTYQIKINRGSLAAGIYFLRVNTGEKLMTQKIVIE